MIVPSFLQAFYRRLSYKGHESDRIFNAMMQATKGSMDYVQSRKVCDLLVTLKRCRVATNDVENGVRRTCHLLCERQQMMVKMKIMLKKVADAFVDMSKKKINNAKSWKEAKKVIVGAVRVEYMNRWRSYMMKLKHNLVVSNSRKIEWLRKKWRDRDRNKNGCDIQGIKIKNTELEEEFSSAPRLYGGVSVSEKEMKVLSLPPKFGIYRKVNRTQCKIDVEESVNKLRWNTLILNREDGESSSDMGPRVDERMVFVDGVEKKVDIKKLLPRDLPFNPQVAMPAALSMEDEVKIFQLKNEVAKIADEMAKRSEKWSNLDDDEKKGLKSLERRVNEKEIVCTITDKSGRWSCDTIANYKKGCLKLVSDVEKTPMINADEHEEAEREMNCHALALTRMLGLGDGSSGNRLRNAITAEGCGIAPLYGLRKDHKPKGNDEREVMEGPKMRPVCGARDSLTKRTSYMLCKIITPLIEGEGTHCSSTEDLIAEFGRINGTVVKEEWVVGSLDVDSLYPSLDVDRCVAVVKQKLMESALVFENLQWKEVVLYLRYNMPDDGIQGSCFKEYLPVRRYNRRPPLFIRSGSMSDKRIRHQPWVYPRQGPGEDVMRRMFCEAIAIMIKRTMEMHDFQIDGDIYRQSEGGSIGMDLTGIVSDVYMCEWDRHLINGMGTEGIRVKLYKRYKDDINVILDVSNVGVPAGDGIDMEDVIMDNVKVIAEGIDPALKVTTDCSSKHDDGKLPVLDLKVWIGKADNGGTKVLFCHYMKDVASRATIHHRSSHSMTMKKNVMVNEITRILRNCSTSIPWEEAAEHVSYFVRRMQFSGYPEEFRHDVVAEAVRRYEKKMEDGLCQFRREGVGREQQQQIPGSKHQWYSRSGKYDSVMYVEATPGSELMKKVQNVVKRLKMRIKVVERVGATVKGLLQRSNPFGVRDCGRDKCLICCQGCGSDCRTRGCMYEYVCEECQRIYRGQTGRSIYERNRQQIEAWVRGEDECPLQKHANVYHGGGNFVAELKILAKCYGKPSKRLITEAVVIDELPDRMTMNRRSEWSYVKLAKVQIPGQESNE